jgi:hypothetical protein
MMGKSLTVETKEVFWLDMNRALVVQNVTRNSSGRRADTGAVYRKAG